MKNEKEFMQNLGQYISKLPVENPFLKWIVYSDVVGDSKFKQPLGGTFEFGYRKTDSDDDATAFIICTMKITPMVGCKGVAIFHDKRVHESHRNKGVGTFTNNFACWLSWELGYSVAMCSVIEGNMAQRVVLAKNGWNDVVEFLNKRTGNEIVLYTKDLSNSECLKAEHGDHSVVVIEGQL